MKKIQGQLEHSPLEGGVWTLAAQDGTHYQLEDLPQEFLQEGQRLEVEGDLDQQAFGLAMVGPLLQVKRARRL